MGKWNTQTVPVCKKSNMSDEVLVTYIPKWNEQIRRVIKAVYIPYHHCTDEDLCWDITNADVGEWECANEEEGTYWIPSGWYETIDNSIDDCNYVMIDGTVIAWSKMIKPYNPKVEDISKVN